ncbi:MAG: hypothetical protein JSV03_11545 [Planctomycetota bacterium]|nr:MAG: hypothetical protein JSV03_11545 [Planctomycetota bacterium]
MVLILALSFYRQWTRPWIAGVLLFIFIFSYLIGVFDSNFFRIAFEPDNIPITLTIISIGYFVWLALRRMAINDQHMEQCEPLAEGSNDDQVLVWPDLIYIELILMVICTGVLILWSIFLRAPLEAPANPALAPNPAKAPWYFLGIQEMLVYFDPWIDGVLLPVLIIVGLCALPYLDRNPKGNGYYTFKERPFAISVFLFGFIVLWVVPIIIGIFLRGPNWNFYGPFEYWDPHKTAVYANENFSKFFWTNLLGKSLPTRDLWGLNCHFLIREAPGLVVLLAYFILVPLLLRATLFKRIYAEIGRTRYVIMSALLACMALVPIKMLIRWIFDIKYIVAVTEWSLNI